MSQRKSEYVRRVSDGVGEHTELETPVLVWLGVPSVEGLCTKIADVRSALKCLLFYRWSWLWLFLGTRQDDKCSDVGESEKEEEGITRRRNTGLS